MGIEVICRRMKGPSSGACASLIEAEDCESALPRPGYVPMVIGEGGTSEKRVLVHTRFLKHPALRHLLEMAAQEFGYNQSGVLRIPCVTNEFCSIVHAAAGGCLSSSLRRRISILSF